MESSSTDTPVSCIIRGNLLINIWYKCYIVAAHNKSLSIESKYSVKLNFNSLKLCSLDSWFTFAKSGTFKSLFSESNSPR